MLNDEDDGGGGRSESGDGGSIYQERDKLRESGKSKN